MQHPEILEKMTLEEKASLCSGFDYWHTAAVNHVGVPSIMLTDGPHGIRKRVEEKSKDEKMSLKGVPAICYPTACATACSWDPDLIYKMGEALGDECLKERVSVLLGPGTNIKRSPLCGRNFEYFSEDPYLAGEMAASFINGVPSKGIGTSVKHFAANNQETRRMTVNTVVDERTLREIYLAPFETAVKKAQPWTIMAAYNRLNGTYCAENKWLLTDVLRKEWGYKGIVVTDWGAENDRVTGLLAGQELGEQAFLGTRHQVTDDVRRFAIGNTSSDTFGRHLSGGIALGEHATATRRTASGREVLFKIVVGTYAAHHRRSASLPHMAIDAVDVGEQNQQFCIEHTGNQPRQFVVIGKHQFGNAQGIVLIHDGQYAVLQHHGHAVALIEIFLAG